jgi:anti-sigma regulatory factor (Ser/Thr protein kinase)
MRVACGLGFGEVEASTTALVVTETAKNLIKHAGGGEILLRGWRAGRGAVMEVLAIDRGPGIRDVAESFADGYSSAATPGTGLGAIARLSHAHGMYSQRGKGTVLFARIGSGGAPPDPPVMEAERFQVGAVSVAKAGESECGDAWGLLEVPPSGVRLIVADGLGHGPLAAEAARTAVRTHAEFGSTSGASLMQRIHQALRQTRGAAVALAEIDQRQHLLEYTGIGNIGGYLISTTEGTRPLTSQPGTAGHEVQRIVALRCPWKASNLLVVFSDGLASRWSLDAYPGLMKRHPSLIAGVLYRDFARGRDDATVVVIKEAESAP